MISRRLKRGFTTAIAMGLLISAIPACIIPVAPDFQDPVVPRNEMPYLQSVQPLFGEIVVIPQPGFGFTVIATDPNESDTLQVRWILNPAEPTHRTVFPFAPSPPPLKGPNSRVLMFPLSCTTISDLYTLTGPQQFELAVTDRMFDDTAARPDVVANGGIPVVANWTIIPQCPTPSATAGASP